MSGNLNNRKVYVGTIPYKVTEQELKDLAANYGTIETLFYMQDQSEQNKGWAFVTYKTKEEADKAVVGMKTQYLHNSDKPLTAEIAPTKTNSSTAVSTVAVSPVNNTVVSAPVINAVPQNTTVMANNANPMMISPSVVSSATNMYAPQNMLQQQPAATPAPATSYSMAPVPSVWQQFYTQDGHAYYYNTQTCQSQWERPPELDISSSTPLQQTAVPLQQTQPTGAHTPNASLASYMVPGAAIPGVGNVSGMAGAGGALATPAAASTIPGYMPQAACCYNPQAAIAAAAALAATTSSSFGPPGSNLFIFHVPNDWNDYDLVQHFQPFGNILSARIHRDRNGNNKGYGFISYDNIKSSINAIRGMNGFAVCGKHLKVQVKKGEERHIPTSILQSCSLPHGAAGAASLTNGIFIGPNAAIRYAPY